MPLSALIALVALALLVGCSAWVDRTATRRESAWEERYPPLGLFETVEGRRVHLIDTGGTGPVVVLIHGANGNLRDFAFDLVGRLSDRYRVIALDRPGFGWSDGLGEADTDPAEQARILRQAVAQRGARRPIVVGHSYGGAVAMAWALDAGDDIAGVVLLGGATHPWDGSLGAWYRVNATPVARPARALATALAPEAMLDTALESVFAPQPVPEGYEAFFGTPLSLRRAVQETNTRQVNALNELVTRMQPRYATLTIPIEALHGTEDTIVGLDIHSRRMAAEVASARLTVMEGVGHMPHHADPAAVTAAIDRIAARR